MKARRLKTIARWINESLPGYRAEIREGYRNTDRKIPGTRLRHEGRGRWGNVITVFKRNEHDGWSRVFEHNSAETYRSNQEVEDWLDTVTKGAR